MTDLVNMKFKALLQFPAIVSGGAGIAVDQNSGRYTFNLSYSEFGIYATVPASAVGTTYYLGWNSTTSQYGLLPVPAAGMVTTIPITVTASPYTMGATDSSIFCYFAGTTTVTLLSASDNPGRWVYIKTITANTVVSATSNVGALATGTASTAILAGVAGRWALLQSNGVNWQIMAAN